MQAECFLHFAQNISFLVISIRCARTFIPAENGRNNSLVFQIFPATELFFNFLRAKMLLTHFSVFRHNKSVSVFLSFNCQKPPIPFLQRKRKK